MKRLILLAIVLALVLEGSANLLAGGRKNDPSITKEEKRLFFGHFEGVVVFSTPAAGKKYDRGVELKCSERSVEMKLLSFQAAQKGTRGEFPADTRKPVEPIFFRLDEKEIGLSVYEWDFVLDGKGGLRCLDGGNLRRVGK